MSKFENALIIFGIIQLVFTIIVLVFISRGNAYFKNDKYKHGYFKYFDLARLAEINGNKALAIENYVYCLYFLENRNIPDITNAVHKDAIRKRINQLGGEAPKQAYFYN